MSIHQNFLAFWAKTRVKVCTMFLMLLNQTILSLPCPDSHALVWTGSQKMTELFGHVNIPPKNHYLVGPLLPISLTISLLDPIYLFDLTL